MCSFFWRRMESGQGGDLGDIIRASSGCGDTRGIMTTSDGQFPSMSSHPISLLSPIEAASNSNFGDPFHSNLSRDPLLHELSATTTTATTSLDGLDSSTAGLVKMGIKKVGNDHVGDGVDGGSCSSRSSSALLVAQTTLGEEMSIPCNSLSRFLQISPTLKNSTHPVVTRGFFRAPPILAGGDRMKMNNNNNPSRRPSDHAGQQMSSSLQTPGIKRRKSQEKKVVCIPATASSAGSTQSREIVPSDLWAWRKYGQKPIKGSPYPRGYYKCSSSKGCLARKQVERSRTDPSMLVITYTSEHNHPWPTQRNALAGSTRSQPPKSTNSTTSTSKDFIPNQTPYVSSAQKFQQHKEMASTSSGTASAVKEEEVEMEKEKTTHDDHNNTNVINHHHYHHRRHVDFPQNNHKPMFPESCNSDDFFADLGELEPDPMELLVFSKDLLEDKPEEEVKNNEGMDPFNLFHWAGHTI